MLGSVTIPTPIGSGVHISFAKPSEQRAAKVLPGVIQSALSGNLTAIKCMDERRGPPGPPTQVGVAKERAVWAGGYNQVVTQRPELLTQYNQYKDKIPAINHSSPEAAAQSALANPFSAPGMGTPSSSTSPDTPALSAAANQVLAKTAALPLWLTLLLAGGLGYYAYKMVKKG